MAPIRRLVLDLLKPRERATVTFTERLVDTDGVTGVSVTVVETDQEVETLGVVVEGDDIDFEALQASIADAGVSLHSVDQVVCGDPVVEDRIPLRRLPGQ